MHYVSLLLSQECPPQSTDLFPSWNGWFWFFPKPMTMTMIYIIFVCLCSGLGLHPHYLVRRKTCLLFDGWPIIIIGFVSHWLVLVMALGFRFYFTKGMLILKLCNLHSMQDETDKNPIQIQVKTTKRRMPRSGIGKKTFTPLGSHQIWTQWFTHTNTNPWIWAIPTRQIYLHCQGNW